MKLVKKIALYCLINSYIFLTACTYGSAAMTGAQAFYDRHSLQKKFDDNITTFNIYNDLYVNSKHFTGTHISIATFNDSVLIIGQIPDKKRQIEIEDIAKKYAKNRDVYNYTELASPSSMLVQASDSWITAKIKARLIAINDVDPSKIKVITENGIVYLLGIVPHEQASIAVDVAKETIGVQDVIKLFSYVTISKV